MTPLARRNPHAFGLLVTFAGVIVFVPDALVMRLIGGDMLALAVYRGTLAGSILLAAQFTVFRDSRPNWRTLGDRTSLLVIGTTGVGSLLWSSAMGATSAANALLILATAPFMAALLSWLFLREKVDRATVATIAAVFVGVAVIASGSLSSGKLLGDIFALGNAATIAVFYVALRSEPNRNLLTSLGLGYLFCALLAAPMADFQPIDAGQAWLILLSGGVILPGAVGLLMLGPRFLPAAEVSMITLLEIVLGPLLVWAVIGENPGTASLIGGAIILVAILLHTMRRLRTATA